MQSANTTGRKSQLPHYKNKRKAKSPVEANYKTKLISKTAEGFVVDGTAYPTFAEASAAVDAAA